MKTRTLTFLLLLMSVIGVAEGASTTDSSAPDADSSTNSAASEAPTAASEAPATTTTTTNDANQKIREAITNCFSNSSCNSVNPCETSVVTKTTNCTTGSTCCFNKYAGTGSSCNTFVTLYQQGQSHDQSPNHEKNTCPMLVTGTSKEACFLLDIDCTKGCQSGDKLKVDNVIKDENPEKKAACIDIPITDKLQQQSINLCSISSYLAYDLKTSVGSNATVTVSLANQTPNTLSTATNVQKQINATVCKDTIIPKPGEKGELDIALIVGATVGGVAGVVLISVATYFLVKYFKKGKVTPDGSVKTKESPEAAEMVNKEP